jgi:hypothetical protein
VKTMHEPLDQPRPHSLGDLDRMIVEAENARDWRWEMLSRLPLGQDLWPAQTMLELADEQLIPLPFAITLRPTPDRL